MKKLINQIERLIIIIIITLVCYFSICKNLILLDMHKISILEFKRNICDALYKSDFKAFICGLIDVDTSCDLYDEITDKILKA